MNIPDDDGGIRPDVSAAGDSVGQNLSGSETVGDRSAAQAAASSPNADEPQADEARCAAAASGAAESGADERAQPGCSDGREQRSASHGRTERGASDERAQPGASDGRTQRGASDTRAQPSASHDSAANVGRGTFDSATAVGRGTFAERFAKGRGGVAWKPPAGRRYSGAFAEAYGEVTSLLEDIGHLIRNESVVNPELRVQLEQHSERLRGTVSLLAEEARQASQRVRDDVSDRVDEQIASARAVIVERPLTAVATAALIGLSVGWALAKRR